MLTSPGSMASIAVPLAEDGGGRSGGGAEVDDACPDDPARTAADRR